ncbi:MAG: peptide chain release factor N(5)-glutamine methyltransferase [Clostridiales Family XIII bacterium]|jgi:release factor glutamine methyltransferase|nr:peptide chain release factor N(5)-glutamine methyltransferase [Clostridiales Family XIII bacterium]
MSLKIKEILVTGENRLREAGCGDHRLDAELLLLFVLKCGRSKLFTIKNAPLDEKLCEEYFRLLDVRASGTPVQYITGVQEFMGLSFLADRRALIPRQDTETLVERVLEHMKNAPRPRGDWKILDLCTGSGAVAVSLCAHAGHARLIASDISGEALALAKENAARTGVRKRVRFVRGDMFAAFRSGFAGRKFDIIVSNPPYIPTDVLPALQREIYEHEPLLALDGGADGLDAYRKIAKAADYLRKNGMLFLEIGYDQADAVTGLLEESGAYADIVRAQDLAGRDRVITARLAAGSGRKNKR